MKENRKNGFVLQFHITGKCNQRCKHCYFEEYDNEILSYDDIVNVIEQFKHLIKLENENNNVDMKGHISITGGEPFLREDIYDIIKVLKDNEKYFTYAILSNGSFINHSNVNKIKGNNLRCFQVSIDGDKEIHDFIRGNGNFTQTFEKIDLLKEHNIPVTVSFTANKLNYKTFPIVAEECDKHNVDMLWSDRMIPVGNGKGFDKYVFDVNDFMDYIQIMNNIRKKFKDECRHTQIVMARALQFIVSKEINYKCSAGDGMIVVDEKGDVMPCRRMPIICGNVLRDSLSDIYYSSDIMKELRNINTPSECNECRFKKNCSGGAKCFTYSVKGDYNSADPLCPLIHYNKNCNI